MGYRQEKGCREGVTGPWGGEWGAGGFMGTEEVPEVLSCLTTSLLIRGVMAVGSPVAAIFHGHALPTPTGELLHSASTWLGGHCSQGGDTWSGGHLETSPTRI